VRSLKYSRPSLSRPGQTEVHMAFKEDVSRLKVAAWECSARGQRAGSGREVGVTSNSKRNGQDALEQVSARRVLLCGRDIVG